MGMDNYRVLTFEILMGDIIFRFGEQNDISQLNEVQSESITVLCRSHYTSREIKALALNVKPYQYWISHGIFSGFFVLIAEIDSRIVGFSALDGEGIINGLYVLPKYSRKGIGSKLLARVESIAKQKNIKLMSVTASLNAQSFYEKLGYQYLGDSAWSISPGVVVKAILMNKSLT
ncbi:MAG: GNAT family N-acetyltransferase [Cyanobacteria bacterium J06643_13]